MAIGWCKAPTHDRRWLTTGVFKGVHFPVQDGATFLYPAIVATADDSTVMNNDGPDRYSTFDEAKLGLVDRYLHKLIQDRYSAIDHGTILHRAIEDYPALIWRKTKAGCRTQSSRFLYYSNI